MIACAECNKEFLGLANLHKHLKTHDLSVAAYYQKHHPKLDLLSGERIEFKNFEQYQEEDFVSVENFIEWLKTIDEQTAADFLKSKVKVLLERKGVQHGPPSLFFKLSKFPSISVIKKYFPSYLAFCAELEIEPVFTKKLPDDFWQQSFDDLCILQDTREQLPFDFANQIESKLDFGDYTAGGEAYSKTFIERKAVSDFVGTFGKGFERFCREMDRAVVFNSYVFVVVEGPFDGINKFSQSQRQKINLDYVYHNMRTAIKQYPKNMQIVFAYSRGGAKKLIPKILGYGADLWNVDLNYFVEEKIYGVA